MRDFEVVDLRGLRDEELDDIVGGSIFDGKLPVIHPPGPIGPIGPRP